MNMVQSVLEEEMEREIPGYTRDSGAYPIISIRSSSTFLVCVRGLTKESGMRLFLVSAYLKLGGSVVEEDHHAITIPSSACDGYIDIRVQEVAANIIRAFKRRMCHEMESLIGDLRIEQPEKQ